jgi:hypothetical protein
MVDMIMENNRNQDVDMVRNRIARAFDIVIYLSIIPVSRYKAKRVITEIAEIRPLPNSKYEMQTIVKWDQEKETWTWYQSSISKSLFQYMVGFGAKRAEFEALGVQVNG